MPDLVLLRHGQSTVERREPVHRLVRRRPAPTGRGRGPGGRPAAGRREADLDLRVLHTSVLTRAIRTADLALRGGRAELAAGPAPLAAQRAPLRRPPGPEQEGDHGRATARTRSRSGGAATPPRRRRSRRRATHAPGRRPPLPGRARPRSCPATECLADVVARVAPLLGGRHRARPAGRGRAGRGRAGRRPRQQPPGPAQAPRRHRRRRHRRTSRSRPGIPFRYRLATTCRCVQRLPGRPGAARAAAEAVGRQAG